MPNLTEISRRFRSFLCTSNSTVENTIRPSQITNVGAVTRNVNSVWEEKQILLLQKLSDFTYGLSKSDFHEYYSENPEDTSIYETHGEEEENDEECGNNETDPKNNRTVVTVPSPGNPAYLSDGKRYASSLCAICLCPYGPGDRVSWSSNHVCKHVFHEECIVQWFMSLITKQRTKYIRQRERERRNRRNGNNHSFRRRNRDSNTTVPPSNTNINSNPTATVNHQQTTQTQQNESSVGEDLFKTLPKECPCCRQDFISDDNYLLSEKKVDVDFADESLNATLESSFETDVSQATANEGNEIIEIAHTALDV